MSLPGPNIDAKKEELLDLDIRLRRRQDVWENPRNIAILVGATAVVFRALAGWLGYQTGRQASLSPQIIIQIPPNLIAPGKSP
jgi:hypothetical protein